MSLASLSPPEPSEFYDEGLVISPDIPAPRSLPPSSALTRTIAILKTHALQHRLDIEPRLLEASFEVVKERRMVFDTETDPETLYELFGDDAQFLGDGPVWVYVLERRRAVQVLLSLLPSLGDTVMASKTDAHAEMQIAALFASSPPFPTTDLPSADTPTDFDRGSIRSVNSAVLEALQLGLEAQFAVQHPNAAAARTPGFATTRGTLSDRTSNSSSSGKQPFRARPLPKTHMSPDIKPRLTKTALLRQGLAADGVTKAKPMRTSMGTASTGRVPPPRKDKENSEADKEKRAKERAKQTFMNVPGHKRADTICVASTAPPVIAPRLTKAAALRLGLERPATPPGKKRVSTGVIKKTNLNCKNKPSPISRGGGSVASSDAGDISASGDADGGDGDETETERHTPKNVFEGVPGHKRRETISVPSTTRPPSITPRINRSAVLRKEGAPPPSSFMFRVPTTPGGGHVRSSSALSAYRDVGPGISTRPRSNSVVPGSRASSRMSSAAPPLTNKTPSRASSTGTGTSPGPETASSEYEVYTSDGSQSAASPPPSATATRPRRPSSLQVPTIAPRANKSAMLRMQKQASNAAKPKNPYANASKR
ncbi:hypothetical protein J3A83DRAFT_4199218 [Scleroderma citrinum]